MSEATPLPYWRLSAFYFAYYGALGAFTPYFARWLAEVGHSAFWVSAVMALWYATRIVAPPMWSLLCARSPRPLRWLHLGAALTVLSFSAFLWRHDLAVVLLAMAAFSFFANAILPQFESITFEHLGTRRAHYGRIRAWGSIGFLLVAAAYGPLFERNGYAPLPNYLLPLLLLTFVAALLHRHGSGRVSVAGREGLREALRLPGLRRLLWLAFLMQISFGPFYVFYTIHLDGFGYSASTIGALWTIGVLAEVVAFAVMPHVFARVTPQNVLQLCLLVTVLRWAMVAVLPENAPLMFAMQLLHALSFGAFHAACMQSLAETVPTRLAQHAQALLYGLSSGIGGVIGALWAGQLWQLGAGRAAFLGAAVVAGAAIGLARRSPTTIAALPR